MKKSLIFLLVVFFGLVHAQKKLPSERLLDEIQQMRQNENNLKIVWWIPADYWELAINENGQATPEEIAYLKSILEKYTIMIVGDYSLSAPDNTVDFKVNDIKNGVIFRSIDGQKVSALNTSAIDDKVLVIIDDVLKPLFIQMIGKMGSGLSIFVYDNWKDGKLIIDPYKPGKFQVEVNNDIFKWQTPLISLLDEKRCSIDQMDFPGNYIFCPIHGNKL